MVGSIEDQDCVHHRERLVMPASIFIQPAGIDGCDLYLQKITNGIDNYILTPGGTLQHVL